MKRKMLILDIDGTLTNSKKEISEETRSALIALQKKGNRIVIATGRPIHGVKWVADALKLEEYGGYILCFNGARIMNAKTKEIVYQQKFPKRYMAPLYRYVKEHDMGFVTYENDKVITGTRRDSYMEFEAQLNHMQLTQVEDFLDYVDFDVNKCLFTAPEDVAYSLEQDLVSMYGEHLSIYRSEPYFIEVMPKGVDKAHSLKILFQMIGVNKEDTVACGDGYNDISMLQYAGVGVAMANAQEAVKEQADVVTRKTNDENGLLEVIDTYF